MLDTRIIADSKPPLTIIDEQFLSIMTTLFIEGMALDEHKELAANNWADPAHCQESNEKGLYCPVSISKETEAIALKEYGTRKAEPHNSKRRSRRDNTGKTIRAFILGLSDAFNNLLMGVWGNLSLINLTIDKSNPVAQRVSKMELLIQNGSALINGIFGYMGERRIVAKDIRLNQLIRMINEFFPIDCNRIKREIIQASRINPSSQNTPAIIAGSLAGMLSQLMERIQGHYDLIVEQEALINGLENRLRTIERLMNRGLEIITLLRNYSGSGEFRIEKVSVKALTNNLARKFRGKNPHLELSLDIAQKLPRIYADRSKFEFVLNQLMENAANSMPTQGKLKVEVRRLQSENPQHRCIAYRCPDSVVVTISDTGCGMDLGTLLHIFDPFHTGQSNSSRLGMGLAAVWGVVKRHSGYIHVRSKAGHGSTFKVYLPIT